MSHTLYTKLPSMFSTCFSFSTSPLLPSLFSPWSVRSIFFSNPTSLSSSSSSLLSLVDRVTSTVDWFPFLLWAVPKQRTSHSKKRMRMATKGLKNLHNITVCRVCQGPKLIHHLCPSCLANIHANRPDVMEKKES
ncbi:hypothetical protein HMI54_002431 [Coelomomyces lativittatus]|nr:hypothetical protein HMI56_001379 [Coelomomyces lativittatus]KAJ1509380.1 hypothetical protein HMI54_002431 [Coelomomyces lativittatus]KAJ1510822.1 hypothetical protein HMI55_006836 [Coelomomyces lativittatus]